MLVVLDHRDQRGVVLLDRHPGEHPVDLAQVDPGGGERRPPRRRDHPRGLGHLGRGHPAGVMGLGEGRQVLQRPAVADQPRRF
ncbi:hypothetical protein [Geodermatophilus sp. SYSU D00696]